MKRELVEEAAVQIDVLKPLYLSENLFVESGEYRHEVILYFLAPSTRGSRRRPSTCETTSGTRPRPRPGRCCRRTSPRR